MQTSNLNRHIIKFLVVLLGLSGWITSAFIYSEIENQRVHYKQVVVSNAKNIVGQALNGIESYDEVSAKIKDWHVRGATAQTGSIETICKYDENFFVETFPHFTGSMIKTICSS